MPKLNFKNPKIVKRTKSSIKRHTKCICDQLEQVGGGECAICGKFICNYCYKKYLFRLESRSMKNLNCDDYDELVIELCDQHSNDEILHRIKMKFFELNTSKIIYDTNIGELELLLDKLKYYA